MKLATFPMIAASCALALTLPLAQGTPDPLAPRPNGMSPATPDRHILLGGTVHTAPGQTISAEGVPAIYIEDGRITAVLEHTTFADLQITGYQIHKLSPDTHIYPGFIDPYVEVDTPQLPSAAPGTHWSRRVKPHDDALRAGLPDSAAESLRAMGFTTAMIAPDEGIFRGWTAVVSTADDFDDPSLGDPPVHLAHAGQAMGFDRGRWGDRTYPTSHMGVVAIMRQTFADAQTRRAQGAHDDTSVLDHIHPEDTTLFYDISHELEAALADNIAREFDHPALVIVDNGTAHRRLNLFKEMGHPVIVPLRFPETPDVFSVGAAESVDLATLQHWERAPANARWLLNSGLQVALTTSKRRKGEKFWDNLHTAIEKGLPPDDALAMLTTNPARILGLENHGVIAKEAPANLVVASGDLFDPNDDAKIIDTWIDGRRHRINEPENKRFDGSWTSTIVGTDRSIEIRIDGKKVTLIASAGKQPVETKATNVVIDGNSISFLTDDERDKLGPAIHSATLAPDGTIRGTTIRPASMEHNPEPDRLQWVATRNKPVATIKDFTGTWRATLDDKFKLDLKVEKDKIIIIERAEDADDIEQEAIEHEVTDGVLTFTFEHEPFGDPGLFSIALTKADDDTLTGMGTLPSGKGFTVAATREKKDPEPVHTLPDLPNTPFGPFAYERYPEQGTYLLRGATVWTQSDAGVLKNAWVLISNGKISRVGDGPEPRVAPKHLIDATGMHITPGLIDAHSHTGLFRFGVNESGQAVTAECRISDSLDPGHPGFYRELAGGLTTANLLHGSANPIGGQSQTVKLRWNSNKPSDMFFEDAKPGIKFALGENVKQSNWGDNHTTRYPQTRMGVETLMRDRFMRAREYAQRGNKTEAGYRDLELETLAEILAGQRLVHCHSYRQDEILMLCRIAEEFGFKIGTFQHGLETYKVAEVVKEHAIGASIFSDWWAYKYEVVDAIPFAGPINFEVGLLTSYNSDSDDVARRMNVEAGKALKYAKLSGIDMSEQDALNFVTLNPAKQLMIDDRVGSLEPGKDADLVVWTGHPLSSTARPEMTFVDGRLLFSRQLDARMRARDNAERLRIIQLIARDGKPAERKDEGPHRHDEHDSRQPEHEHEHGQHFNNDERGDCGCSQLFPAFHTGY